MIHKEREILHLDFRTKYSIVVTLILIIIALVAYNRTFVNKEREVEIISESSIAKIINVSELSTFEATYNGIANSINEKGEIDYHVSYEAKVKAGIDFEKVEIEVDNEAKKIIVKLPEIKINEINVDITTLGYIFKNKKAETDEVSAEAYKLCIDDVTRETKTEAAIYDIAKQNATNTVEALVLPFIQQLDSEYSLCIE